MFVGLPASGKSSALWTMVKSLLDDGVHMSNITVLSTDAYIEDIAKKCGKTYNEIFKNHIKDSTRIMYEALEKALAADVEFVFWDQTNLTSKSRKQKFDKINKDEFETYAIVFEKESPTLLHNRMVENRPDKIIGLDIIESMYNNFEDVTEDEGFDKIIRIKNGEKHE